MDSIEKALKYYSRLIPSIRHLNYDQRLKALSLHYIQRCFDRYTVIYMNKIQHGLVPNPGVKSEHTHGSRNGPTFHVPDKNRHTN